jgi:ABC-type sugar transport system ATPase subunit
MGSWRDVRWRDWWPFLDDNQARARANRMVETLSIRTKTVSAAVRTLSGGNQQKVVFGRWLLHEPRIMLLDEPTRGVDIGARQQIWKTVEDFAAAGDAVIAISSDLEELSVCHRVIVLVEGRDVGEIESPDITEERILATIYNFEPEHTW